MLNEDKVMRRPFKKIQNQIFNKVIEIVRLIFFALSQNQRCKSLFKEHYYGCFIRNRSKIQV